MLLVSVVIPVKNGAATLSACIDSIQRQTIGSAIEIILVDSGSSDDSLSIAKAKGVRLVEIAASEFNHGQTRNFGAGQATGKFIFFTVQDAILATDDVLERMLAYFDDTAVMGVCGSQAVPHELDKNPVDWYLPRSPAGKISLHFETPEQFDSLSPRRKTEVCGWDDVIAMYRKSGLEELPFVRCDYGEDMVWCKQALINGWLLIRDTSLITWHYHFQSYDYRYKVRFVTLCKQYLEFDYIPEYPPLFPSLRHCVAKLFKHPEVSYTRKFYWFFHNVFIWAADFASIRMLRRAIKSGGVRKVRDLNERFSSKPTMGRLKGQ
jgi:rhamnosyltransferase